MSISNRNGTLITSDLFPKIEESLNNILFQLGIMPNIQGFKYIKECVIFYIQRDDYGKKIAKESYIYVAKIRNIAPSGVERAIRHAICVSFSNNKIRNLNIIMKVKVFSDFYKPANSELLALLAEKIKSQYNLFGELSFSE